MDGKKRIARLRNAEKWKKLGLKGFGFFKKAEKGMAAGEVEIVAVGINKPVKKKWDKDKPRTDGKIFDWWSGMWKDPAQPQPGRFGTAQAMINALEKKGYKRLGAGHYSTVLGHPKSPDKVIKITRHQDNWIDYVKWAAENGYAGGFGPKVYSWKKFPAGWSWAVVERMARCVGDGDRYCDFGTYGCSTKTTPDKQDNGDDYEIIFTLLHAAGRGNLMAKVYAEDLCPGAVDYVAKLREEMRASDIRAANTMVRKDGSLCFTDPCAGETKITSTRFRSGDFSPSVWRFLIEDCYRHRGQQA